MTNHTTVQLIEQPHHRLASLASRRLRSRAWLCLFLPLLMIAIAGCYPPPNNLVLTTSSVDVCSPAQITQWNTVVSNQQGVDGRDPEGHRIGNYPAERGVFLGRNWYPAATEKQVLCGTLDRFNFYDPWGDEADWNNFMIPDPPFQYLITTLEPIREDGWHRCNGVDCMEAEITPDEHFYGNPWFPKVHGNADDESPLEGQNICVYGPWVWEEAHGNRPEIHPSELYWWRWNPDALRLMLLHDDSNRFYDPDDFADLPSPTPDWWRPWSEAPRTGQFRVAFEVDLDPLETIPTYIIRNPGSWARNVITSQFASARRDSDYGREHAIEYNGVVVLQADEYQPIDDDIGVQFVEICRNSANTRLQGYVQLRSVVGTDDSGGEGYHVIDVLRYELDVPEEEPPFTEPSAPEITVVSGKTLRQTLRRQEDGPQPELLGDLEISLYSGMAEKPLDMTIARVELVDGDSRQELEFQASAEDAAREGLLGVVKAVPALSGSRLELTTNTGAVLHLNGPEVSLAPLILEEKPLQADDDPEAWDAMRGLTGASDGTDIPQPAQLQRVAQWQLDAAPYYAPIRDGRISPEDDSPASEELTEVWHRGEEARVEELFGSSQPFTVDWSFTATNLVTGEPIPVATGEDTSSTGVQVAPLESDIPNASIEITFPESAEKAIVEVVATATFQDTLGNTGEVQHRVWSHVLAAEDGEVLTKDLLATMAVAAGISPDDLVEASNLENADPSLRAARTLRLMAMHAAGDGRVTVAELQSLIQGASLLLHE